MMAEVLAAVSPWEAPELVETLRGRRVIQFVDNMGALASFVAGAGHRDFAAPACRLHERAIRHGALVWFEYVVSAANVADHPSREAALEPGFECKVRREGWTIKRVPMRIPNLRGLLSGESLLVARGAFEAVGGGKP